MKTSLGKVMLVVFLYSSLISSILASELTHDFKNPAFSGNGYSSHVLSINQLEVQREQKVFDDLKSAAAAAEREEKNKTVNKFIANVESRIYANLSKQLVDNMFGTECDSSTTTCPTSGTSEIEGATISWVKDTTTEVITLTITADDGTVTTMSVPIGDFKF
jgi:hypothetical protein|tara:strand:- start:1512 stop:1997 length:486 start_codon:yes stop_codon:yes gene_type:complete